MICAAPSLKIKCLLYRRNTIKTEKVMKGRNTMRMYVAIRDADIDLHTVKEDAIVQ